MKQPIWDTYPHVHLVELLLCFWHSVQKLHCRVVGIVCHIPHPRELIVLGSIEQVSMLLKGALCCCRNVMFIQLHSRQVSAWLHSLHKNVSFYSFFNRRTSFFCTGRGKYYIYEPHGQNLLYSKFSCMWCTRTIAIAFDAMQKLCKMAAWK